jgi:hypothetical protein
MSETGLSWEEAAARSAQAQRSTFLVGVRSHNGSWFAHCDGEEVDGSSAADAAFSLIDILWNKAVSRSWQAKSDAASAEQRAIEFGYIADDLNVAVEPDESVEP